MIDNEEADDATVTEQETPPRGAERSGGRDNGAAAEHPAAE